MTSSRSTRRRPSKNPTIFDVAAEAGVSKSTVSNVIRETDDVSDETRERVRTAIALLNYKPNAIARQFVTQRTTMLGVLVGDLDNPYYAHMARVVERAAFAHGYTAMFCNIEGEDDLALAGVEALLEQRVAGVVLLAISDRSVELESALRNARVPIVFVGLRERWGDSVAPRDSEGGELATEHLLGLGHVRIAYVRTPLVEHSGDHARHLGYRKAMRNAGQKTLAALTWVPGAANVRAGRSVRSLEQLLRDPDGPTAVFVSNDIGAIALIEACEARGIDVPGHISVVGFDDIAIAGLGRISLTTIAQAFPFQAEAAVELLLKRIARPSSRRRHLSVPVELRVRDSTAPPR